MELVFFNSERSSAALAHLKQVFLSMGYQESSTDGLQSRWHDRLQDIRLCNMFIAVISPDYLDSQRSRVEYDYAQKLNKPILPILIEPINLNLLPPTIATIQLFDYQHPNRNTRKILEKVLANLPRGVPLPDPLPPLPELPQSRIDELSLLATKSYPPLPMDEQMSIVLELKQLLESDRYDIRARDILEEMLRRKDLVDQIRGTIQQLLILKAPTKKGFGRKAFSPRQRYTALFWLVVAGTAVGALVSMFFSLGIVSKDINGPLFILRALLVGLCLITAKELPYVLHSRYRHLNLWFRQGIVVILSGFPLLLVLLTIDQRIIRLNSITSLILPVLVLVASLSLDTFFDDNYLISILSGVIGLLLYFLFLMILDLPQSRSMNTFLRGESFGGMIIIFILFSAIFSVAHYYFLNRW